MGDIWAGSTTISREPRVMVSDVGNLEYKGHLIKDTEAAFDKLDSVNDTISRWRLKGIDNIEQLKKAPREISKLMLGAVTKIAMHKSTLDVAFKFEEQAYKKERSLTVRPAMDRPAFMMALAYEALGFGFDDIEDNTVAEIFRILNGHKDDLDSELRNEIIKLERKAITLRD